MQVLSLEAFQGMGQAIAPFSAVLFRRPATNYTSQASPRRSTFLPHPFRLGLFLLRHLKIPRQFAYLISYSLGLKASWK